MTGSFVVGTTDYFDFTLAEDTTTEGVESFNIQLNNGQATAQVQIADTSQAAAVASYSLGLQRQLLMRVVALQSNLQLKMLQMVQAYVYTQQE